MGCCADFCILLCCFLFPPFAILFRRGCEIHFFICWILTAMLYLPGVIHAIYVCFYMDKDARRAVRYAKREQVTIITQQQNPVNNQNPIGMPLIQPQDHNNFLYPNL